MSVKHAISFLDYYRGLPSLSWCTRECAYMRTICGRNHSCPDQSHLLSHLQRLLSTLSAHRRKSSSRSDTPSDDRFQSFLVQQIEQAGRFPDANYAFDNGVLWPGLTRFIEACHKQWVSELECSRNIQWDGDWVRVDALAWKLRKKHPETFRYICVECRNGETKEYWAYTKVVRLKRYGRKRLVIVHETSDLSDPPRYLLTSANHWNSGRIIQTWSYRWSSEVFHEFAKQVTGLESSQVRKEEAVKRHFRLSCVSQSLIQRASAPVSESERYEFARGKTTFGQRCRTIAREVFRSMLELSQRLFAEGKSCDEVLDMLMPA